MMEQVAAYWELWWVWCAAALILAILEVLAPGFVFLGFAFGALACSILLALLGSGTLGLPVLVFLFAALSLVCWLLLRRFFALPTGQVKTFETDINDD
jgi:membrane protein implicated in regulation of membrane protease activity